jgi:hypothetical protein
LGAYVVTVVLPEVPASERVVAAARRVGIAVGDGNAPGGFALMRDPTGGPSIEVSYGPLDEATGRLHGGASWALRVKTPDGRHPWAEWQQAKMALAFIDALDGRLSAPGDDVKATLSGLRTRAARPPTGMLDMREGEAPPPRPPLVARLTRFRAAAAFGAAVGMAAIAAALLVRGGSAALRPALVCGGFAAAFVALGVIWLRRPGPSPE